MKRRDFIVKSGMILGGAGMAFCPLFGCGGKQEEQAEQMVEEATTVAEETMSKMDMMKKHMMEKMGLSEAEVAAKMKELEEKLPEVKKGCICAKCPSWVEEETELGFCHPMVGKSEKITERRGCICPECPVYKMMDMKNGYYCVQGSELELNLAKM